MPPKRFSKFRSVDKAKDSEPVDPPVTVPVVKVEDSAVAEAKDSAETCGSCLYYSPHPGGTHYGECTEPERRRTVSVTSPSCPAWTAK